jgi:lipid II:glycine glycyltransferase (peptidoglycan interpeptide bridge formation enzyme)
MRISEYSYQPSGMSASEWNDLISASRQINLIQSWEYGEAKALTGPWQVERGVISDNNQIIGAAQTMVRRAPVGNGGMAWINRGPLLLDHSAEPGVHYAAMLAALNAHFVEQKKLYLRLAPMIDVAGFDKRWASGAGLQNTGVSGWASSVVDLSQSAEALRKALHGKWRNGLVRAERSGISVRSGFDEPSCAAFIEGHREHLRRLGGDGGIDENLLRTMQELLPKSRKIYFHVAYMNDQPIGGIAIAKYGQSGEYLAGHNSDAGRTNNAGQLLLWSAMMQLRNEGVSYLDLGGMDEKLTPAGIYRFKQRVGGSSYRLANEFESGSNSLINKLIRWQVARARSKQ